LRLLGFATLSLCTTWLLFAPAPGTQIAHGRVRRQPRVWVPPPPTDNTASRCDAFASPSGSDTRGRGTRWRPFRSPATLERALAPGETGCLRGGRYGNIHTKFLFLANGTRSNPITITSYPGERAKLVGWIAIEASHMTLSHVEIDGSNTFYRSPHPGCHAPVSQGLAIAGHGDALEYNDYYQSVAGLRSVGIGIGWWGNADNTILRYNRIHDVGQCQAYDSLIYLARGNQVQIYGNWLWNDRHGRGVQLYPGPRDARIFYNVVDHAGGGFLVGDEGGETASGNQLFDNIVVNSTGLRWDIEGGFAITDYWGGVTGTGNTFHNNISYANPGGIARVSAVAVYDNLVVKPHFANAAAHDYTMVTPAGG